MKKFVSMLMMAALLLPVSCSDNGNEEEPVICPVDGRINFSGTMNVEYGLETYTTEGVAVDIIPVSGENKVDILFKKVKFVPQMPVTLDVTISGVPYTFNKSTGVTVLSADTIVPLAGGAEYPAYTATNISGKIMDLELALSVKFGDYPTIYTGSILMTDTSE